MSITLFFFHRYRAVLPAIARLLFIAVLQYTEYSVTLVMIYKAPSVSIPGASNSNSDGYMDCVRKNSPVDGLH